jgi:hypothetical protein
MNPLTVYVKGTPFADVRFLCRVRRRRSMAGEASRLPPRDGAPTDAAPHPVPYTHLPQTNHSRSDWHGSP